MINGIDSVKLGDVILFIGIFFGTLTIALNLASPDGEPAARWLVMSLWILGSEGFLLSVVSEEFNLWRYPKCST